MIPNAVENFEIDAFLKAINVRYGYDLSGYSRASLKRRIKHRMAAAQLNHVSEMIPMILHDESFFDDFLNDMSITVTEMFRNPEVFKSLRENVLPLMKTYPRINIWHAACATGEEVYSLAIVLEEEGLLHRANIYATDFNNYSLNSARKGIYPSDKMKLYTQNYDAMGGKASFSDYYHANYESAKMKSFLTERVTFANHNLVEDKVFAEMHLVLCRNVLIYFQPELQSRVLGLIQESLVPRGFLVLGDRESIRFTAGGDYFEAFDEPKRIYRKANRV